MDDHPGNTLMPGGTNQEDPWQLEAPLLLDILSVTSDAILVMNSVQQIVFFNQAAEQIFGFRAADIIGQSLDMVIPPNYVQDHYGQVLDFLAAGEKTRRGKERLLVRGFRKDGSSFPADVTIMKYVSGERLVTAALVRDVSEQQLAEAALNESEAVYRSVITALEEGILIHSKDGTIGACNPSAERILGMPADELTRLSSLDPVFRPIQEDGSPFPHPAQPAVVTLQEGRSQSGVVMGVYRPDGELVWLSMNSSPIFMDDSGQPMAVVVSFSDITGRKNTLDALRRSEERFNKAFNSSPAAISIRSLATGEYLEVNQSFVQLVGFERQEVITKTPGELGILTGAHNYNSLMDLLKADGTARDIEIDIRTKSGEIRNCLVSAEIIELQGEPAVLTMISDFTERRQFEQAQALASLHERQRLARELHDSVSQALYGIALGARTARTLLDRSNESDLSALEEPLDYVLLLAEAGLAEMRALIFELRPESLEMEGLSMALSKQAAALAARHPIRVETSLCEEPQTSLAVKEAFYRIAQEALNNIIKHAGATEVRLTLDCAGTEMLLVVDDNGQGFDPGGDFPGHLGLRSMSERIEKLGGRLTIESNPGKGSRVSAWLSYSET